MKKLIFSFIFTLILFISHAQIKSYGGIELFSSNRTTVWERGFYHEYNPGDMSIIYGVKYDLRNVQFKVSAITYMHCDKLIDYKPSHAEYTCSASYRLNDNLKIKLEHMCIHPIENARAAKMKLFGGYTKVGIYWNM